MRKSAWIQGLSLGCGGIPWPHVVMNTRKENTMKNANAKERKMTTQEMREELAFYVRLAKKY
jgi:hypothetical protein